VFIPDVVNRPHIALVMEVEPPPRYLNDQGFFGFLNAAPTLATLTTGTITITGIDTTGIAVGNDVYIRDQVNNGGYAGTGTVVVDVNFQSVTLNKGLIGGGGIADNPGFFTLYFCGNAYYTVLSSTRTGYHKTIGNLLIPAATVPLEIIALNAAKDRVNILGITPQAQTFISNRFSNVTSIITATNFTIAQSLAVNPQTSGPRPTGADAAITAITINKNLIVAYAIAAVDSEIANNSFLYRDVVYDKEKCKRDIRIILAEVVNDLTSGGNSRAISAGLSYWQGPQVFPAGQQKLEIDSINYIKAQLTTLMTSKGVGSATRTFVNNRFDTITSIITANSLTTAKAIIPNPVKTGTPPADAALAILTINQNVSTIAEQTVTEINRLYNYDSDFYSTDKCKRDIALILKQIVYDIESGGNYYSTYAGLSYWLMDDTHHIVELGEAVNNTALFPDGVTVNFYQRSYISASGYLFEYVGAGTNYGALPQRGVADPIQGQEVIQLNNGKVFFTSTDQNGDFRIGPGLVISQATGVLSGRTFTKSLFANMTPFILAISG
jgi:hypothetical protein